MRKSDRRSRGGCFLRALEAARGNHRRTFVRRLRTASPGMPGDADLAARRLAAWRRSSAAGDEALFARRLERDGLTLARLRQRFAAVRPRIAAPPPAWLDDAVWIEAALHGPAKAAKPRPPVPRRALRVRGAAPAARRASRGPALARARCGRGRQSAMSRRAPAFRSACFGNCPPFPPRPSMSVSPRARRCRCSALRSIRRRHEVRRIPPPVRGQAGAVAPAGDAHAAVDRHVARIRRPPCRRSAGDPSRLAAVRRPTAASPRSKATSPIRTMAAARSRSCVSRTARASSTSQRISGSTSPGTA